MMPLMSLHRITKTKRSYVSGKKTFVPMASMSIQEMLRRFVRREALPVEKEAVYIDAGYDLEKVSKMDRVDQQDILDEVREKRGRLESDIAAEIAKAKAEAAPVKKKVVRQKDPKNSDPKPPKG